MQTAQTQTSTTTTSNKANPGAAPTFGGNFLLTPSLMDYVAPDLTTPEQYFSNQACDDGMGPERALMYAVLKDGIRSFYKNVGATRRKYKKIYAEADEWLSEDCWEDPFSFRVICDTLGIDSDCLRSRLFAWRDVELERRAKTGDTSSVQVGRSPFPTPVELDGNTDMISDECDSPAELDGYDQDLNARDEDDSWSDAEHVSLEDLSSRDELGYAA